MKITLSIIFLFMSVIMADLTTEKFKIGPFHVKAESAIDTDLLIDRPIGDIAISSVDFVLKYNSSNGIIKFLNKNFLFPFLQFIENGKQQRKCLRTSFTTTTLLRDSLDRGTCSVQGQKYLQEQESNSQRYLFLPLTLSSLQIKHPGSQMFI